MAYPKGHVLVSSSLWREYVLVPELQFTSSSKLGAFYHTSSICLAIVRTCCLVIIIPSGR
ncbi:MAG: hypothetical protein WBB45_00605 [Cyclobacteriaceae bacterium]